MSFRPALRAPFAPAFRASSLCTLPRAVPPVAAPREAADFTETSSSAGVRASRTFCSSVAAAPRSASSLAVSVHAALAHRASSTSSQPCIWNPLKTATSAQNNLRGARRQSGGIRGLRSAGRADASAAPGEVGAGVSHGGGSSAWSVELVPCLTDNYAYLIRNVATGTALVVDPSEAAPVAARLEGGEGQTGGKLAAVLCTHHHWDHTGGNLELKDRFGATVVGPAADRDRIPAIDVALSDGDTWQIEGLEMHVLHTPGHTRGHCALYFPSLAALFTGDTLFSLGCGRLFEGSPAQMWASLSRLAALPPDTRVYCGHEYTQANARFAMAVEPSNVALQQRTQGVTRLRSQALPTIPTTMGVEAATNPFLRPSSAEIRGALGVGSAANDVDVFAALRRMKDNF
ncbi:hypothetical protein CLOM_g12447 [Closterium sp. NIES-68]|nr:hypothetical protein CLOM_g12447 [Closterium sp. NIES-68]GJP72514.1 hypothetical protein CLOP_g3242 [Closterium sp. NIES-67]